MRKIQIHTENAMQNGLDTTNFCISASRAYTLMLKRHQEHLKMAAEECGFRYLRFHGLFQDDMGIYREDAFGNPIWGWQYVDEVYDFLQEIGMRPFVVFDFMPEALRSADTTIYWEKSNITPPKDYEKWGELVYRTARHFVERYGEEEVAQWLFEVWNEPDGFFFTGGKEEYYKLYAYAARAVKKASPRLRIGGPSVAGEADWIEGLIAYCMENEVPLDFITGHNYCNRPFEKENKVHPQAGFPVWTPGVTWQLGNASYDPNGGVEKIEEYRKTIAGSAMPQLELYLTEFGLSYDYWDPMRDSYEAASYLISRLNANAGRAGCLSLCEVSDIFEEDGPPTQDHFHGGFGLINLQGIRKPTYFVYKFLAELSKRRLACPDAAAIACGDAQEGVQVIFWDETIRQDGDNKAYFVKAHVPEKLEDVALCVEGLKPGKYLVETYVIGYRENDAYTAFMEMPHQDSLTRAEVEQLKALASGKPCAVQEVCVEASGCCTYLSPMRENDVRMIKLIPQA